MFRYFPENPALNDAIPCGIKNRVRALRAANEGADGRKRSPEQLPTEALLACAHTHNDDEELQRRYRLQLWFLNFCKYLYMLIYTFEVRHEELKDADEDEVVDGEALESKQQKIKDLQQLPGGPIKLRKVSKTRLACKNILKCLAKQAESFTMEERAVLKDHMSAKTLLESPLIKIIEEEMQEQILEYKVHHAAH